MSKAPDWRCPACRKIESRKKAVQVITCINGEWIDTPVCKYCYLAGRSTSSTPTNGGLVMRQRAKKA